MNDLIPTGKLTKRNKFFSLTTILVLISVVVRIIVYMLLSPSDDFGRYPNSCSLYFSALSEHFRDYLVFTTNIPPGTFVIQAAVLALFNPETAMTIRIFVIFVSILDVIAVVLLFKSARRIGANKKFAFIVCCLFSIALISFEIWRDGMHYDHLTFFFTAFFAWSLVRVIRDPGNLFNALLVSVTTALLVSQSAANAAIAPFSILAILVLLLVPQKNFFKLVLAALISLSLPLLVLVMIGKKNAAETTESLTSNKAGPAMMMVVQRAYGYDATKVRSVMQRGGAPEWYLWTYDHAQAPQDPATYQNVLTLSQAFGMCFFSATGPGPWQFDFQPLQDYLSKNGPAELVPIVKADAEDAVLRPYRFAGFSPELSSRWIGVYGSVSKKIFFKALLDNPAGMLTAFAKQQSVFGICGPLFMYNVSQNKHTFLARGGLRTLKERLPLYLLIEPATLVFAALALGVYILSLGMIPFALLKSVRSSKRLFYINHPFLLLSIPVLCIAVVYSCLVGGENDRYFMQATPYIVIMGSYLTVMFRKYLSRYHFLQPFIS